MLTIVMYHYVRDLPNTPWPRIKGLLTRNFDGQLDYIQKHYTVCSDQQVIAAAQGRGELPGNACLLTFDDGFSDHFETVFPRLVERNLSACFFPTAKATEEHEVLVVHKLHFILAACSDMSGLFNDLMQRVAELRSEYNLPSDEKLLASCIIGEVRFEQGQVISFKRLLQQVLPRGVARRITSDLFKDHVTHDEVGFAQELYASKQQLKQMYDAGMGLGGHGYQHNWLEHLPLQEQVQKFQRSRSFLSRILGQEPGQWIMNYPYGSYNTDTLKVAPEIQGCALALSTKSGLISDFSEPHALHRLDTNDLPHSADAPPM